MTDRDRLIELIQKMRKNFEITCPNYNTDRDCDGCKYQTSKAPLICDCLGREVDHLLANGVIVPPCKVGDIIYHLYPIQGIVAKKVKRIQYGSYGLMIADGNGVFHSDVIGKTVFLTKEEAEEKLKELGK